MATKKTTDQPPKPKPAVKKPATKARGVGVAAKPARKSAVAKPATAKRQSDRKPAAVKSKPVVLDPPKAKPAPKPKSATAADVIDAKVISSKPVKPSPTKKSVLSKAPPTEADAPLPKPAVGSLIRGLVLVGTAVLLVAIGVVIAGRITGTQPAPGITAKQFSALKSELETRLTEMEATQGQFGTVQDGARDSTAVSELANELQNLRAVVTTAKEITLAEQKKADQTIAELQAQLAQVEGKITAGAAAIGAVDNPEMVALIVQFDLQLQRLSNQIAAQEQINAELLARLDAIDAALADLAASKADVTEISEFAQQTADRAELALALSELGAAVKTGAPYARFVAQFESLIQTPVSGVLLERAHLGITPLHVLQQQFPNAARIALKASLQAAAGDGLAAQVSAYVKSQISARSLEERDGDDPDAILSRAEAALGRGQLRASVDLVRQLPDDGINAMQGWLDDAEKNMQAQVALQRLADSIGPEN